jgi:hypothetical protein
MKFELIIRGGTKSSQAKQSGFGRARVARSVGIFNSRSCLDVFGPRETGGGFFVPWQLARVLQRGIVGAAQRAVTPGMGEPLKPSSSERVAFSENRFQVGILQRHRLEAAIHREHPFEKTFCFVQFSQYARVTSEVV